MGHFSERKRIEGGNCTLLFRSLCDHLSFSHSHISHSLFSLFSLFFCHSTPLLSPPFGSPCSLSSSALPFNSFLSPPLLSSPPLSSPLLFYCSPLHSSLSFSMVLLSSPLPPPCPSPSPPKRELLIGVAMARHRFTARPLKCLL